MSIARFRSGLSARDNGVQLRAPQMQPLESRCLFNTGGVGTVSTPPRNIQPKNTAPVVAASGGTLYVYGALRKTNAIVVKTLPGSTFDVSVNGKSYGVFTASAFSEVQIWGGNLNDKISMKESTSRGGAGGAELDLDLTIRGRDGNDRVDLDTTSAFVNADGGDDTILGSTGDDYLAGDSGNDKVYGGSGDDIILGGKGNDDLRGDAGDDRLAGERGNDDLDGGSGSDHLDGGEGKNHLVDYSSRDERNEFQCGDGRNFIYCSRGDKLIDFIRGYDKAYFN